ncbi:hypothetical protein [Parafrankia elaeagni]|uniref:hypothetical protein n=1 Tax=Parafrankia elaeagni TaxID=222534 RepID=UPI00035C220C|nr:hypothetical protein [Parafrankia elaeagni]
MSTDELGEAGGPEPRPERPPGHFEQIIGLISDIIADWGRTLRVVLLLSVPLASVVAAVYGIARLAVDPQQWWKAVACMIGVYVLAQAIRLLRRRIGKTGPRRR